MLRLYGRALHRVDARLAQRLRLVEHRHRALLRRVLRPDREPQPDLSAWAASPRTRSSSSIETVQRAREAGRDRRGRAQRLLPQRQLPVRDDPRGGAPRARSRRAATRSSSRSARTRTTAGRRASPRATAARRSPRSTPSRACACDPETGEPYLKNRYGAISGRAIKPIGLRVVAELRDAGLPAADHRQRRHPRLRRLPRVLLGGRRCRVAWAPRSGCEPMPLYALGPVEGLRIRRLIDRVARYTPPAAAPHWEPGRPGPTPAARPRPRRSPPTHPAAP